MERMVEKFEEAGQVYRRPCVIYTVGLPGSGKTTWAKQEQARQAALGNSEVYLMSMDDIRAMGNQPFSKSSEFIFRRIWMGTLRAYLSLQKDVIVHDTNFNPGVVAKIKEIAESYNADVKEVSFIHVPLETCLQRNEARQDKAPLPTVAIVNLYSKWLLYKDPEETEGDNGQ